MHVVGSAQVSGASREWIGPDAGEPFVKSDQGWTDAELRQRLREDGYVFLPALLPRGEILSVREAVVTELHQTGVLRPEATTERPVPARVLPPASAEWASMMLAVQRVESLHRLPWRDEMLGVMARLLDATVFPHPQKIPRVTFPAELSGALTTPPHQDFRYDQGATDTITAWIPLGDCPRDHGGLAVVSGSHRRGLLPIRSHEPPFRCALTDPEPGDPDWRVTDYRVGDVLLFHSLTIHGALANRTQALRLSVDCRFQSAAAPISQNQLHPAFYPRVPDWPDIVDGWSTQAWIAHPADLDIVPFDPSLTGLEVPPSAFA